MFETMLKFFCNPPCLCFFIPFIVYGLVIMAIGLLGMAFFTRPYDNKLKDRTLYRMTNKEQ